MPGEAPRSPRILVFTGKGGVGKTTVAAATALRCADAGLRTVVVSTDPAHSLADAFDVPLSSSVSAIAPGLWGQQLDAQERLETVWSEISAYVVEVLGWLGVDPIQAEELSVIPGLDEMFSLSDIKAHAHSGEWDVIVVDCAPTAETIRFLSLPDILSWYMERVFPVGRALAGAARPLLSRITDLPVASDEVFAAARRFYDRLEGIRELLTDANRTSVRLVVNPERMVIAEARRTYTYLSLFGYRVDAVIANRLLPAEVVDPWFEVWKRTHAAHLSAIEDAFRPVPVLRADLAGDELVGAERLRRFAESLYGPTDPSGVLYAGPALSIQRRDGDFVLSVPLPFVEKHEIDLGRLDGELLVRVGPYKRALLLPDSLRRRKVQEARMVDDRLEVTFSENGGQS